MTSKVKRKPKVRKYREPEAGEWVNPTPNGYLMQCCDCGLVHRMDFRAAYLTKIKGKGGDFDHLGGKFTVLFRVYRAERETKRQRKARGIKWPS